LDNNKQEVKPVMLVVAKDTAHASALRALIDGDDFRGGSYKGKVIEVHTKTKGEESDETIEKLISLEHPDNVVEIVIHVNMLKEGWDVTNIYTIAPIRASASEILTEQTIGRGLRLPYGERTGNKNVDRVMIVAHDNYAKVIEGAKNSNIIQPTNIESISIQDANIVKEVVEVPSAFVASIQDQIKSSESIMKELEAHATKAISSLISDDIPEDVKITTIQKKTEEYVEILAKREASKASFLDYHQHRKAPQREMEPFPEDSLFGSFSDTAKIELEKIEKISGQTMEVHNIPIPRLILTPNYSELKINVFDLDIKRLSKYATETSILEARLQGEKNLFGEVQQELQDTEITKVSNLGEGRKQSPENTIIAALWDYELIDYDSEQRDLLLKLSNHAVEFYRSFVNDDDTVKMMVENNFRQIAKEIYTQILEHKEPSQFIQDHDVQEKKKTAEKYCELVSKNIGKYGIVKPWRYMIVPTEKITISSTIMGLLGVEKDLEEKKSDLFFSDVIPEGEDSSKYLPVYSLAAACGKFVDGMEVKEDRWVFVDRKGLDETMFVVRAVGDSMEPRIKNGDYCIFKANSAGPYSQRGGIYLFQYQGEPDPHTGGSYTIKGYQSHKGKDGFNIRVELLPKNKSYSPLVFDQKDGDISLKLHFVAAFVGIL